MTDQAQASPAPNDEPSPQDGGNTISPLPGEAGIPNVARRQTVNLSWKNISIIGLVLFMVGGITFSYLYRLFAESGDSEKDKSMLRDRPSAAGAGTRQLDMTPPATPRVLALISSPTEAVDPIGLRNTRTGTPSGPKTLSPDDAPVLVVSSRPGGIAGANGDTTQSSSDPAASTSKQLQDYQRRLQGLLDNLTQGNALPAGLGGSTTESTPSPDIGSSLRSAAAGLFGGELQGSATYLFTPHPKGRSSASRGVQVNVLGHKRGWRSSRQPGVHGFAHELKSGPALHGASLHGGHDGFPKTHSPT